MKKFFLIGSFVLFCISNLNLAKSIDESVTAGRKCYSCSGINCSRPTLVNVETNCKNESDQCVSTFHEMGGTAFRGCLAELPTGQVPKCQNGNSNLCAICSSDLCNNVGPANAQCVICSSKNNSNCLQLPNTLKSSLCPISTSMNTYCYVKYSNRLTDRGCATTDSFQKQCLENPEACYMCSPTDDNPICNNIVFPANRSECWSCKDGKCTSALEKEFCALADDDCISLNVNGMQIKKCVGIMTNGEREYCDLHKQQCIVCYEKDCNSEDAPENNSTYPPENSTTLPPGNSTTLPPVNDTTLPSGNITTLPPGNDTTLPPENNTTATEDPNSAASMTGCASLIAFVLIYSCCNFFL